MIVRSKESSAAIAVGTATLLTGLIGAGASAMLGRAERAAMTGALHRERVAAQAHVDSATPPENVVNFPGSTRPPEATGLPAETPAAAAAPDTGTGLAASVGAAAADTRALEPVGFLFNRIPGWSRFAHLIGTDLGIYSSRSAAGKRTFSEIAETSLRFKQNTERTYKDPVTGETRTIPAEVTSETVPLDRETKLLMESSQVKTQDELKRLYSDYFFGQPDATLPYIRGEISTRMGTAEGKLAPAEFDREVAAAMQSGDTHAIPQVEQAAQFIRREVIAPWAKRMEAANPDFRQMEFGPGESYFPYRWEGEQIAARRPEFVDNVVLPHLEQEQATKAAAKERLTAYSNAIQVANDTVAKLTRELEVTRSRLDTTEIRADEAGAGTRAVLEPSVRRRTNVLADRVSGQEAKIADLEERLVRETENAARARSKIEAEIAAWEGKSVAEAKSAIKAREKADAARTPEQKAATPRLASADDAIDRVVKDIIKSNRDLSREELRAKAEEITDHIVGTPIGRIPYDIASTANATRPAKNAELRGPLHARDFAVPYAKAKDWLSHDLDRVLGAWMRTMVPDTLLWERFPGEGPALNSRYRQIQEEYAAHSRGAKSEKERTRLNAEKDRVIATISGVLDRVRGVANNTVGMSGRVGEGVRRFNQMTDLGFAGVTSIPDMGGAVLLHGITNTFRDGWAPLFKYLSGDAQLAKMSKKELRDVGIAIEMENATRGHAMAELSDAYSPRSTGERMLKAASDRFFMVNMQAQETNVAKRIAGRVAMAQMLRAVEAETAGKATQRQITALRESNITTDLSRRIWQEFSGPDGGSMIDGTPLPNTALWADDRARTHFLAAVARDVDRSVVTPGQEKPLWISTNVGSLLGQYKSFSMAATNKLLISSIQRHDAQTLQGVLTMVTLGMLSYKITATFRGQKTHDRPQDWVKEGFNRSGFGGVLEDVNMFAGKATRGTIDAYRLIGANKPLSRNANRTILSSLLGPTAGKIENITRVTGAIGALEFNEGDTHAIRRSVLLQNVFWLNGAFSAVEAGANNAFGIEMKAR